MTQDSALRHNPGRGLTRVWRRLMDSVSNAIVADGARATQLRRVRLAGVIGVIGHPLYFVIWSYVFPQPYESVWLRLLCTLLFVPLLFAERVAGCRWLPAYAAFAITAGLPFAFVFLYLENAGTTVWAESLLIAVVILFHFSTAFALFSLVTGAAAAMALFLLVGKAVEGFPWHALLEQVPILAFFFVAGVLVVIRLDRQILIDQKQHGMALALGTVAHELRTPLASLALTAKGIQNRLPEAVRADHPDLPALLQAVERMRADVLRATNSIELLVANSKDPLAVSTAWFDPHEAIRAAIDAYPFEPGTRSHVRIAPSMGLRVLGNAGLFEHIITNLTKNALEAIQRVGKGDIRIGYERMPQAVEIVVRDTGAGVSPVVLKRMFQPFFSHPAHRGTGIGLTFCRKVLRGWGASISCRSVEHEFTEFRIRFPNPR
ncbi:MULTISPECIES: sensor histidine kinase [Ralstonia solanacearum species complex]|uniref:sensor histidine kinase n=1 Tax=Ralstonia solanacearum species complex TaxID=3116862 RepID=UPI000E577FE8|nr:HAMP domain-containing sensor histidine kinase [Ralstonia solanacearum]AXV75907.1 two-component sensor histidine kinase [Ralstonia solanacearum]AXV89909.1 two-component sensor histidine kinase [Ralstonia solanacearum]AXW18104.1 two-component sensor histidine kinase [Ralstonia solanacearum]AXW74818.1 two-component sensor histidine kinase [Ralstonia solanacearum]